MSQRQTAPGNTLIEYTIVGALVAVAAVGGIMLLGKDLNQLLSSMKSDLQQNITQSQTAASAQKARSAEQAVLLSGLVESTRGAVPTQVTLPSAKPANGASASMGSMIPTDLSNSAQPQDLGRSVQTVGANGTTTILSNNLTVLAKQLLEAGKIDQAQANQLSELANHGYRMANLEKVLEEHAATATSPEDYKYASFEWDGVSYRVEALAKMLGQNSTEGQNGAEMQKLFDLYDQAKTMPVMSDPEVAKIVANAFYGMKEVADAVEDTTWKFQAGTPLGEQAGSKITERHAGVVCKNGGGPNKGFYCPPVKT